MKIQAHVITSANDASGTRCMVAIAHEDNGIKVSGKIMIISKKKIEIKKGKVLIELP